MFITYLLNSGFMIRDEKILLVFDDYDRLYIFATHAHFDHFGTHIRGYEQNTTRYIFSNDIKHTKRVKIFPKDKITYMKRYTNWSDDTIKVWSYDSTDVGISFLVELPSGARIFHAGDFNWWHWEDDTPENIALAEKVFKRQVKQLDGMTADVAFFPVDGRLGSSQEKGATEFVARAKVKSFVAMHRAEYPRWEPTKEFSFMSKYIPTWSPTEPGESRSFDGEKFLED